MELRYTIKIKDDKNPPVFNEELGKGVLATYVADFKGISENDLDSPSIQQKILDMSEELKNEWIEIVFELKK